MDMREQMDAAWRGWRDRDETSSPEDRLGFELGFIAALNHIRNPSDEMVERCARHLCEGDGYKWMAESHNETANGETPDEQRDYWREKARACLAAAVGGTTQ